MTATEWIRHLNLEPHPEGGFYRQTYEAALVLPMACLPEAFSGDRSVSTAIYYLLRNDDFSTFHRISSDEMWHFYAGDCLLIHVIEPTGEYRVLQLGSDPERGDILQAMVPAGCWFAAGLAGEAGETFALVGCTVSPGFAFADFSIGDRGRLLARYPQHATVVERFTREKTSS